MVAAAAAPKIGYDLKVCDFNSIDEEAVR